MGVLRCLDTLETTRKLYRLNFCKGLAVTGRKIDQLVTGTGPVTIPETIAGCSLAPVHSLFVKCLT